MAEQSRRQRGLMWPPACRSRADLKLPRRLLLLMKDGRLLRRQMRQESITEDDLRGLLREQGVSDLAEWAEARMERDGRISVIRKSDRHAKQSEGTAERG